MQTLSPHARLIPGKRHWLLLAALAFGLAQPAAAERGAGQPGNPGMGPGMQNPQVQEFLKTRQELQQIRQQLAEIEKNTIASHPELKKQQGEFQEKVFAVMKEQGHTPKADIEELKNIREKAQDNQLSQQERQSLAQEFQQKASAFQQAQRDALKDEAVSAQQKSLSEDLLKAMQEQNPRTQDLLQRARQLTGKLQQIQQQVREQQGEG